jgi:hypothetical protein
MQFNWNNYLGLSPEEIEFHNKCEELRPRLERKVSDYILDNSITNILDRVKLCNAILKTFPELDTLSVEDLEVYQGLTLVLVLNSQLSLSEKKRGVKCVC